MAASRSSASAALRPSVSTSSCLACSSCNASDSCAEVCKSKILASSFLIVMSWFLRDRNSTSYSATSLRSWTSSSRSSFDSPPTPLKDPPAPTTAELLLSDPALAAAAAAALEAASSSCVMRSTEFASTEMCSTHDWRTGAGSTTLERPFPNDWCAPSIDLHRLVSWSTSSWYALTTDRLNFPRLSTELDTLDVAAAAAVLPLLSATACSRPLTAFLNCLVVSARALRATSDCSLASLACPSVSW
jgi:hypothetical protein